MVDANDERTTEYPPSVLTMGANPDCPRVAVVEGSGPHLSDHTLPVLRRRLRAASLMLCIGFSAFLIHRFVFDTNPQSRELRLLESVHIGSVVILAACTWLLYRRCPHSARFLRNLELLVFGLSAAFFLLRLHARTLESAQLNQPPSPASLWVLLIMSYGMFIPNHWRRAAVVIGVMVAAPAGLSLYLIATNPAVARVWPLGGYLSFVIILLVSALASVVGTHLIGNLRREAFEARQLGQYRLRHLLGEGGMGKVYLAEHQLLKRPCAIKLIHPDQAADPKVLARFEREVRATAQLSHWNTVEIFDFGRTEEGVFYYVMEYLPGLSLAELVQRHGPLPPERVIHFLRQTCQALREAHGVGLIHRDIKPSNLFAAQRGGVHDVVKLLDFGLVQPARVDANARLTREGAISGTPWYMSPEQAAGERNVDARGDIYALGATAYFLLTGRAPFEDDNPLKVMIAHARDPVVPPSRFRSDVPDDLERIVVRCLAKAPADRFQSAEALEESLSVCGSADLWTQDRARRWWLDKAVPAPFAASA